MSVFDAQEIFQFAIRIEENGEEFYRSLSAKLPDPSVKELFTHLADQERVHKLVYQSMMIKLQPYTPVETYTDEYGAYLKAYVDNKIFNFMEQSERAALIGTSREAIDFAIERELDSIMYYQELLNVVPETQKGEIRKIIEEERNHFMKLSELRKIFK